MEKNKTIRIFYDFHIYFQPFKNILCLKKSGKSEHFYVTHEYFLKKLVLFQHFFGKKQALLSAFKTFFTSTIGKSLTAIVRSRIDIIFEGIRSARGVQIMFIIII